MTAPVGAGSTAPVCWAPQSALYLEPDGTVRACCSSRFAYGRVTGPERQSLREIWDGARRAQQLAAVSVGRFDLGCQECEYVSSAAGDRSASLAVHFDRFAADLAPALPKMLDLALSNRCNLQCVMCNGELSSSIRRDREGRSPLPRAYDDRFFAELDELLPHVDRLQFKGGEPFLAPENRRIWDRLIEWDLSPEITITTNGTLMNPNVERYVRRLRMDPIVSVDGVSATTLESIRVGVDAVRQAPAVLARLDAEHVRRPRHRARSRLTRSVGRGPEVGRVDRRRRVGGSVRPGHTRAPAGSG